MTAYYNEIDPFAAQWLRTLITQGHLPRGDVDERSIEDVRPDDLRPYTHCHFFAGIGVWPYALLLAGWDDDRPVWTGSEPCQPHSAAGKMLGAADERYLRPAWHHLIEHGKPRGVPVFGEQVSNGGGNLWIDTLQNDMAGIHHEVWALDIPVASVGAPHIRQRWLWVAVIFQEVVHSQLTGEAGCDEQLGTTEKTNGHPQECPTELSQSRGVSAICC
jgi:DNA (cytosine-5)-methyltransferase 1